MTISGPTGGAVISAVNETLVLTGSNLRGTIDVYNSTVVVQGNNNGNLKINMINGTVDTVDILNPSASNFANPVISGFNNGDSIGVVGATSAKWNGAGYNAITISVSAAKDNFAVSSSNQRVSGVSFYSNTTTQTVGGHTYTVYTLDPPSGNSGATGTHGHHGHSGGAAGSGSGVTGGTTHHGHSQMMPVTHDSLLGSLQSVLAAAQLQAQQAVGTTVPSVSTDLQHLHQSVYAGNTLPTLGGLSQHVQETGAQGAALDHQHSAGVGYVNSSDSHNGFAGVPLDHKHNI